MTAPALHTYVVLPMAAIGLIAGVGLALLSAALLASMLSPAGGSLWRAFCIVASFGVVVTAASLVAGLGGFLHAPGLCSLLATFAASLAARAWLRRTRAVAEGAGRQDAPAGVCDPNRLARATTAVGLVACLVPLTVTTAQLVFDGCHFQFDDYAYHGLMIGHWLQRDALHLAPAKYQAYYPGGGELLSAFFIELGGGDAFAQLASVYWALLGAASVPVAALALGTSPAVALAVVGLFFCSPVVVENLGTIASVDIATSSSALATIAAGLWLTTRPALAHPGGASLLLGLLGGLAVGTKVTAVVLVAPVMIVCGWTIARRHGTRLAPLVLLALLGAVLTGGYWYIRNLVVTGNPVFPAEVLFFDGPLDRDFQRSTSLLERFVKAHPQQVERIVRDLGDWPVGLTWVAGLGVAHALLIAPFTRDGTRRVVLPLLAVLTAVYFGVIAAGPFSGSVNALDAATRVAPRMFLPITMLALLLTGAAFAPSGARSLRALNAAATVAIAALVATLVRDRERVLPALLVAVLATAAWWAARSLAPRLAKPPALACTLGVLVLGCVALLGHALRGQQFRFDRENRGWLASVLATLPPGARIATPNLFSYYALFGVNFELDPFRVDDDGRPYPMLHVEERENPYYSWKYEFGAKYKAGLRAEHEAKIPKVGWRAIEDREQRQEARRRELLASLRASGAQYVLVASYRKASILAGASPKPRTQPFPIIADWLDESVQYKRVRSTKHALLYEHKPSVRDH